MVGKSITKKNYYLPQSGAFVSIKTDLPDDFDRGKITSITAPGMEEKIEIMSWGKDNLLPQQREQLVAGNNIVGTIIARKRDITLGAGVFAYKKVRREPTTPDGKVKWDIGEVEMPAEADEFFAENDLENYLLTAAGELMKHGVVFTEFIRLKFGKGKITNMKAHETKYLRAEKKDAAGNINHYYWSGFWGKKKVGGDSKDQTTTKIPVYRGEDKRQPKFLHVVGDYLFNDGYYPIPTWWGGWEWVDLANRVPKFHRANLENGYAPRWHIIMPADYFLDYEAYNNCTTQTEKDKCLTDAAKKEQDFMDDINAFLAGENNAGRTIFTKKELDELSKTWKGIEILPLNFDLKDSALLELFDKSNTANFSAQGFHPTLANVETQGRLSSGTEMRNAFLMYVLTSTPQPRKLIFKNIELVKRVNGWQEDVFYGIRDFELAPLSESKSGVQENKKTAAAQ